MNLTEFEQRISAAFGVSKEDMLSKTRKKEFVLARYVMWYAMNKKLGINLSTIGRLYGKTPATVWYGIGVIENEMTTRENKVVTGCLDVMEKEVITLC